MYVIVDDEPLARIMIRNMVSKFDGDAEIVEAADGPNAIAVCRQHNPKIALIDIHMEPMTGIELAYHLAALPDPPVVVFVSSSSHHALTAFEADAVDYVVKPIDPDRLGRALRKATSKSIIAATNNQLTIKARRKNRSAHIPLSDIRYFMVFEKQLYLTTANGQYVNNDSLATMEPVISDSFVKVHRNAWVSIKHIASAECHQDGHWVVTLKGISEEIRISRRHVAAVRKLLRKKPRQGLASTK